MKVQYLLGWYSPKCRIFMTSDGEEQTREKVRQIEVSTNMAVSVSAEYITEHGFLKTEVKSGQIGPDLGAPTIL